jgi:AcrR family transcriptional regulator
MPKLLTDADVADFRARLCQAAERLFVEKGPDAVSMRQLAAELGVSPMTPYRYFKDKEEIFAAVRTVAYERFAETLEAAQAVDGDARAKGSAVREAYLSFAFDNPQTYKLIFDLHQPDADPYPDLKRAAERSRVTMSGYVPGLIELGVVTGDPERIGTMFWAATHGVVTLYLAGRIRSQDEARALAAATNSALARGLRTQG